MIEKKKSNKKTICLFGTYESQFPRTKTIVSAAKRKGHDVIECHLPFWELTREKQFFFSLRTMIQTVVKISFVYLRLIIKYFQIKKHDVVIVGYNGYFDMPLAKLLAKIKKKPLVYTPVFPLFETLVEDRKHVNKNSLKSKIIHKIDEISCRLADLIIIETDEYIKYYHEEFGIPKERFFKIPLGADETNFAPQKRPKQPSERIKVLFYGKFIPLQGIRYIIEAAKLLEDDTEIEFEVIGSGQLSEDIQALAKKLNIKNVSFIEWVDYRKLPLHIYNADICLGIFGDTPKSMRGIPIKVYEALVMQKPIITGNSPAAKEAFSDRKNAILCDMANAKALSESILLLKKDKYLREKIAEEGCFLYHDLFSTERIAENLEQALSKVLHYR